MTSYLVAECWDAGVYSMSDMHVMIGLALIFVLPAGQDDLSGRIRELIQKFRSEKVEDRDEAARKLKDLGKKALPELELVAKDKDAEVAGRARDLISLITEPPAHSHSAKEIEDAGTFQDPFRKLRESLDIFEVDCMSRDLGRGEVSIVVSPKLDHPMMTISLPAKVEHKGTVIDAVLRYSTCSQKGLSEVGLHREIKDKTGKVLSDELLLANLEGIHLFLESKDGKSAALEKDLTYSGAGEKDGLRLVFRVKLKTKDNERKTFFKKVWFPSE